MAPEAGHAMSGQDLMPKRLGAYRLLDRVGEGGMGVVFLARGPGQRMVALKVLRSAVAGDPTARRRLAREVETMQRVRSPYVAQVIDADLAGDMPYIVTRYVPGRTLEEIVNSDGPVQGPALARLACGLADALVAVHAAGVVHRDLKPSNVMLVRGSPVVIDFGIAQGPEATRLTLTGMFMGTPGYLAPEVIEGKPSSEASDVHAWGATLAFAATGRPPFGAGPFETIFYRIVNGRPDLEGAPPAMLSLLAAVLARDPAQRPSAIKLSAQAALVDPEALVSGQAPAAGQGAPDGDRAAGVTRADAAPADAEPAPQGSGSPGAASPGSVPEGWTGPAAGALAAGAPAAASGFPADAAAASRLPGGVPGAAAGLDGGVPGAAGELIAGALGTVGGLAGGAPGEAGGLGAGVPGPAGSAGETANGAAAGSLAAGALGAGRGTASGLPGMVGNKDGSGTASAPYSGSFAPHTRPLATPRPLPDDLADVLPPVRYGPYGAPAQVPGPAGGPFPPVRPGTDAGRKGARWHPLLAVAAMVIAASFSVILPVAGTLCALTLIIALRAAGLVQRRSATRRLVQGAKQSDPFLVAAAFPWFLLRAGFTMLLLAPFALATSAVVIGVTVAIAPVDWPSRALAYSAGALVAFYGLGPGSGMARRQLSKGFAAVARTPTAQLVAIIGMAALAVAVLTAAASGPSLYWPTINPGGLFHIGAIHIGPLHRLSGLRQQDLAHRLAQLRHLLLRRFIR